MVAMYWKRWGVTQTGMPGHNQGGNSNAKNTTGSITAFPCRQRPPTNGTRRLLPGDEHAVSDTHVRTTAGCLRSRDVEHVAQPSMTSHITDTGMSNNRNAPADGGLPLVYQIRITGHLGREWADWFEGLAITLEDNGDTLLTGPLVDQAALHGVLKKVRDLGMPLVSVTGVGPD